MSAKQHIYNRHNVESTYFVKVNVHENALIGNNLQNIMSAKLFGFTVTFFPGQNPFPNSLGKCNHCNDEMQLRKGGIKL